jgi:hypothetical protein
MPARIYRVLNTTTGADHLVRAHTQAQAIRHVVAGQETIVEHLTGGGSVMDATAEPEAGEAAQAAA